MHSRVGRITLGARGVSCAVSRLGQVLISEKHARKSGIILSKKRFSFSRGFATRGLGSGRRFVGFEVDQNLTANVALEKKRPFVPSVW